LLTQREKLVVQLMLELLNDYSAHIMGNGCSEPRKFLEIIRTIRSSDIPQEESEEIFREIKEEVSITGSYLESVEKFSEVNGNLFEGDDLR